MVKKVKKSDVSATFDHQGRQTFLLRTARTKMQRPCLKGYTVFVHQLHEELMRHSWQSWTGVYLCIKAYGEVNLTYSLRATLSDCPADFLPSGEQLLCSSPLSGDPSQQRYTQCATDGTCVCKPPYDKPVNNVYPCEILALMAYC